MTLKCENCGYYWQENGEIRPRCHFDGPDDWSPCAQDDFYDEPDHDEFD